MKESIIVGALRLAFVLAFVFLFHAFVIASTDIWGWHWIARLSFFLVSVFVFAGLYIIDKKQNG